MRAGAVLLTALAGLTVSLPAHGNADLRPRGELMEAVIDLFGALEPIDGADRVQSVRGKRP
jgi:hypothetical protein